MQSSIQNIRINQHKQQQQAGSTLTAEPLVEGSLDVNYNKTKRLKDEDESRSGGNVDMTSNDRPGNFAFFFFNFRYLL